MDENWKEIPTFPGYSVSNWGRVQRDHTERILAVNENQSGLVQVGMMRGGIQYHRSVPLLVANAFIPRTLEPFDTPINLDGDRYNNYVENLVWRPRWFAIRYHQQFKWPYPWPITSPIVDVHTGEISANSFECAIKYGLLEKDVVQSIIHRTVTWPTYQTLNILMD